MLRRVILIGGMALAALGIAGCAQQEERGNTIVDIVVNDPDLDTLKRFVVATGLQPTLSSEGPFTVFAPVNSAFDALSQNVVNSALEPVNRDLSKEILLYHTVPGAITSDQLIGERISVKTVQGRELIVDGRAGGKFGATVQVNGCNVIQADIIATNGVVHKIDCVLIPQTAVGQVERLRNP